MSLKVVSDSEGVLYLNRGRVALLHFFAHGGRVEPGCVVCQVGQDKMTWEQFADWLEGQGFEIASRGRYFLGVHLFGKSFLRCGWIRTNAESERLYSILTADCFKHLHGSEFLTSAEHAD